MPSIGQLIIILVVVILLFGTKRLKNIGSDLGGALKGFKKAVNDADKKDDETSPDAENLNKKENFEKKGTVIEGEVIKEKDQTK